MACFLTAKTLEELEHYHLLISLLAAIEPFVIIFGGIFISKKIDQLRRHDTAHNKSSYHWFPLFAFFSFLIFYFFIHSHIHIGMTLIFYSLIMTFLLMDKLYRQRFPKNYASAYKIPLYRINAINNLVVRGTPVVSPLVLLVFPSGFSLSYAIIIGISAITCATLCSWAMKKTGTEIASKTEILDKKIHAKNKEWGTWHLVHLSTMNFSFGGIFFLLSQSILHQTSLSAYLESPVPLYGGFMGMMMVIALEKKATPKSVLDGVNLIGPMSICLIGASFFSSLTAACFLILFGMLFALTINRIGSCIQQNLDHYHFSYYETRAQIGGRIAALSALLLIGYFLDLGYSVKELEYTLGGLGIISFLILRYAHRKLIEK